MLPDVGLRFSLQSYKNSLATREEDGRTAFHVS